MFRFLNKMRRRRKLPLGPRLETEELVVLDPGMPAATSNLPELDPVTEQFRAVRTNLLSMPLESRPRLLLLTSPIPKQGATHTVYRLGAAIAERGDMRVLLVDANLRGPRLHEFADEPNDGGLVEILRGEGGHRDWIRTTETENMDILPAGTPVGNPSELVSLDRMRELLAVLRDEYDFVLVDSPAVRSFAEPAILGNLCDAAIVVVGLNAAQRGDVSLALDQLHQNDVRVLGCVLTGHAPSRRERRQYGRAGSGSAR